MDCLRPPSVLMAQVRFELGLCGLAITSHQHSKGDFKHAVFAPDKILSAHDFCRYTCLPPLCLILPSNSITMGIG